ncbi:MAG: hypothetical protein OSA89_08930 [Mariniblastus sp.]|nr:hypothetical protein [Mariniblastus sp.]
MKSIRSNLFNSTIGIKLPLCIAALILTTNCHAQSTSQIPSGIAWHGVLTDGLADAKATNRPIMLLSAAPQCAGVPGMW